MQLNLKLNSMDKIINIEGLYTLYYLEHDKDSYSCPEEHNFWEMVYVDSGELNVLLDTSGYILTQGDVVFHKPLEVHSHCSVNGKSHNMIVITFKCNSPAMKYFEKKTFTLTKNQRKILNLIFNELAPDMRANTLTPSVNYALEIKKQETFQCIVNLLEYLLIDCLRNGLIKEASPTDYKFLKKDYESKTVKEIIKYLEQNVYGNITLTEICDKLHISKSYACKIFKNETGTTIIATYIKLKTEEAKKLIRDKELNFTQISERLGFSSIHHFDRMFKKEMKITPSEYLKSVVTKL